MHLGEHNAIKRLPMTVSGIRFPNGVGMMITVGRDGETRSTPSVDGLDTSGGKDVADNRGESRWRDIVGTRAIRCSPALDATAHGCEDTVGREFVIDRSMTQGYRHVVRDGHILCACVALATIGCSLGVEAASEHIERLPDNDFALRQHLTKCAASGSTR
jgi:hypothetical protein